MPRRRGERLQSQPSLAEVAARAGVSGQTVSRVANGAPGAETRARVEQTMADLGYRVNTAARALATGRATDAGLDEAVRGFAQEAFDWGLVNEGLPREQLLPRARAIAAAMMETPATTRRLAHSITQRPWRRRIATDLGFGLAHVSFGARLGLGQH